MISLWFLYNKKRPNCTSDNLVASHWRYHASHLLNPLNVISNRIPYRLYQLFLHPLHPRIFQNGVVKKSNRNHIKWIYSLSSPLTLEQARELPDLVDSLSHDCLRLSLILKLMAKTQSYHLPNLPLHQSLQQQINCSLLFSYKTNRKWRVAMTPKKVTNSSIITKIHKKKRVRLIQKAWNNVNGLWTLFEP